MSKIIASAAIRGAHKIVGRAEEDLEKALDNYGPEENIEFPNTGYFLPVVYAMTGLEARKIKDLEPILDKAKSLLFPVPSDRVWVPYLGHALDAGMATLFADEIIEVLKYLKNSPSYTTTVNPTEELLWLGAANDVIMRERGIEFVDGTAPGFAACVGACPTNEIAVQIARELQEKNLYVFMSASTDGRSMAEQLAEEGVQMGWETRLVPFGKDITATVFALGFAARAAMSFGGVQPGDFARNLLYNKNRIFAFVLALGEVDDEKYAQAAGAINFGFPTIADTDIPEILPTGVCTYEHVVSRVPHDEIVSRAIDVRGLKIQITEIPIPVGYGPAFEGERVRRDDMYVEARGDKKPAFEWITTKDTSQVEDGKIEVVGGDLDDLGLEAGSQIPLGVFVEVSGRKMEPDFEPIMERQIHHFLSAAQGILHIGQRDIVWIRISKEAYKKGFRLEHIGKIIHAKCHEDFGAILDKVQVTIYTGEEKVKELREKARETYHQRDERIQGLTDEGVDTYYSCTLCQSFAPQHVCVITPERPGLCGAFSWLDGKAAYEINPTGGNQPIKKGETVDATTGQWQGANEFVYEASRNAVERMSAYSIMVDPMTSCLTGETEVIMDSEPVKIGDFVNKHQGGEVYTKSSALTLNGGKVTQEKIVAMQKFPAPEKLVKIRTKSGIEIILTPDHEVAVDRLSGLSWIRVDQIRKGDRIISLKNLNLETKAFQIIDLLPNDFRVPREEKRVKEVEEKLKAKYGSRVAMWRSLKFTPPDPRSKSISLGTFRRMVENLGEDWREVKKSIRRMMRGASVINIPPANKSLFYLMGLVASDGSITRRGKYEYWFDFINTEEQLVKAFRDTYEKLFPGRKIGIKRRTIQSTTIKERKISPTKECYHIYFNNPLFGYLCEYYGLKVGSAGHWNLGKMISLPREFIAAFLSGIFDGDGSTRIRKYQGKWETAEAYLCIEHKRAASHLQLLMKRLGVVGYLRESGTVYKIEMYGNNFRKFCSWIESYHSQKKEILEKVKGLPLSGNLDKTQEQVLPLAVGQVLAALPASKNVLSPSTLFYYKTGRSRPILSNAKKVVDLSPEARFLRSLMDTDYFLDIVTRVEEIQNHGQYKHVYNLTLAETHAYIAGGGPLVKNCGCFECIAAILPMANGVMVVDRDFAEMTPCGMKFSTLAGSVGGGQQTPGFIGHSKFYLGSKKFIAAEGGIKRLVWLPKALKEELREILQQRAEEMGVPDLLDKIADETVATTEEEVLNYITEKGHPVLEMEPMI